MIYVCRSCKARLGSRTMLQSHRCANMPDTASYVPQFDFTPGYDTPPSSSDSFSGGGGSFDGGGASGGID